MVGRRVWMDGWVGAREGLYDIWVHGVLWLDGGGGLSGGLMPDMACAICLRIVQQPPGSASMAVKVIDFGACFSTTGTDTQSVACTVQTLPYQAPEVGGWDALP